MALRPFEQTGGGVGSHTHRAYNHYRKSQYLYHYLNLCRFIIFSCDCQHNDGKPCHKLFSLENKVSRRTDMANMTSREQMLILLGKLSCTINLSPKTCRSKQAIGSQKERDHQRTTYLIEGNTVSRKAFKFLHAVSQNRLTALLKWYREHGLVPKEKRSGGRNSDRPFSFHDIQRTVAFMTNYAEDHALVLPGRVPGFKREDVKLMPSSETKIQLFEAYCAAMTQSGFRVMSQSVFRDTWLKLTPFILTARPTTDLCWTCQKNNILIYRGANIPEQEKCARLKQQEKHLTIVHLETVIVQLNGEGCTADMCGQSAGPASREFSLQPSHLDALVLILCSKFICRVILSSQDLCTFWYPGK